jgi:hypothetical protein
VPERQELSATWAAHDAEHALHPTDHEVIGESETLRALVLEMFVASTTSTRDLFNACARLGALTAERGGSPTLAAATIDGAVHALSKAGVPFDGSRILPARASLIEGYLAVARDAERAAAALRWEYPACVVPLATDGDVAIACGYPDEDPEALASWAARLARQLVKAKVRRVLLSGPSPAKTEVASAVGLVGIQVESPRMEVAAPTAEAKGEHGARGQSWFRLPWRKR